MTISMLKKSRLRRIRSSPGAVSGSVDYGFSLSLALGFVAFLGTHHILVRNIDRGPNLDRELDSMIYISAADSLANGDGIVTFSGFLGDYSSLWAPLYPIAMALIGFLKIDSVQAGLLVNIAAFGLVIIWTGIWLHRYTGSQLVSLSGAVTVGTSYTLTWMSSNVITEPMFVCLTFLALAKLGCFIESEKYRRSDIVWPACIAALATVTRYLGITIILTAVILIMTRARLPLYRKLKYAAAYCVIAIGPLMFWMVRNGLSIGHPVGDRSGVRSQNAIADISAGRNSAFSILADMLSRLGDVFDLWLFSKERPGWLGLVLVVVVGAMAIGTIRIANGRWLRSLEPVLPFVLFIVIYLVVLFAVLRFTVENNVYDRYTSPIYVPVVVALVVILYRSYKNIMLDKLTTYKWVFTLIAGVGIVGWFAVVGRATILNFNETADKVERVTLPVRGYTRNSEMVDYLINNPIDGTIYSNEAAALYGMSILHEVAELERINYIHRVDYVPQIHQPYTCLSWIRQIGESDERAHLVYLFEEIPSDSCNPVELESQTNYLELVTRTNDGVVYRVTTQFLE